MVLLQGWLLSFHIILIEIPTF